MPLQDTTSITGGYFQNITDWQNGDDRIFTGIVAGVLPASDPSFVSFYFTLKINWAAPDSQAIVQKLITQSSAPAGQITISGGAYTSMLVHVYSGDYEGLVQPGTNYYWDFRGISTGGTTITVATGNVVFQQQVTQANQAGTPASLRSQGQPEFRGFIANNPMLIPAFFAISNPGDFYFNSNPANGLGSGWQCTVGGDPGTWIPFGGSGSSTYNPVIVAQSQSPFAAALGMTIIASASAGAATAIDLPAATGSKLTIIVKKIDPNAHPVNVVPNGTDTIDTVNSTVPINIQYQSFTLLDYAVGKWAQI